MRLLPAYTFSLFDPIEAISDCTIELPIAHNKTIFHLLDQDGSEAPEKRPMGDPGQGACVAILGGPFRVVKYHTGAI